MILVIIFADSDYLGLYIIITSFTTQSTNSVMIQVWLVATCALWPRLFCITSLLRIM